MAEPIIKTAIPKARYRYGEYVVTFLGDVDSDDSIDYHFLVAVGREEEPKPGLFLSCENIPVAERTEGAYRLRAMMKDGEQVLASSDDWKQYARFESDALDIISQMLSLTDEQPYKLS